MAAIFDFRSELFQLFWSTNNPDASYEDSSGRPVQEKKRKIDFQDGRHCSRLGFPIGTIYAIFHLQVTAMLPTQFRDNFGHPVQEKKRKIDFQDGRHGGYLGIMIGTI